MTRRCAAWVQHDAAAAPYMRPRLKGLRTLEVWPTRLPRQRPCMRFQLKCMDWKLSYKQCLIVCWWPLFGLLVTISGARSLPSAPTIWGKGHCPHAAIVSQPPPPDPVCEQGRVHALVLWGKELGGVNEWAEIAWGHHRHAHRCVGSQTCGCTWAPAVGCSGGPDRGYARGNKRRITRSWLLECPGLYVKAMLALANPM